MVGKGLQLAGRGALQATNAIKMSFPLGKALGGAATTTAKVASSNVAQAAATRTLTQLGLNVGQNVGRQYVRSVWQGTPDAIASMVPEVILPAGFAQVIW
jgi:hypothetical protein